MVSQIQNIQNRLEVLFSYDNLKKRIQELDSKYQEIQNQSNKIEDKFDSLNQSGTNKLKNLLEQSETTVENLENISDEFVDKGKLIVTELQYKIDELNNDIKKYSSIQQEEAKLAIKRIKSKLKELNFIKNEINKRLLKVQGEYYKKWIEIKHHIMH